MLPALGIPTFAVYYTFRHQLLSKVCAQQVTNYTKLYSMCDECIMALMVLSPVKDIQTSAADDEIIDNFALFIECLLKRPCSCCMFV